MELATRTSEWQEYRFHQHLRYLDQLARWAPWPAEKSEDDRMALGRRVEVLAAELLADRGYPVGLTPHKRGWDIQAGGARVEVKAARWYPHRRGGRYQAAMHNGQADLVLFACVGEGCRVWAWFVIPGEAIGGRRNVSIWSMDPYAYAGQWAGYLERWDLADEVIGRAGPYPAQLAMPLEVAVC